MTELEQSLREGAAWFIKLADDLRDGKAKEVDSFKSMHYYTHLIPHPDNPPLSKAWELNIQSMSKFEACDHILKLWAQYVYIAECPRTGIRFVERNS